MVHDSGGDDLGRDRDVERAISSLAASEHALRADLADRTDVDSTRPSRLPGWTIGHVMSHLARNADGMASMLDGSPQYPHGRTGRDADIEQGAARTWPELVDDVVVTSEALERRIAAHDDWSGTVLSIGGERPAEMVPIMRQREVEVHRVDLGFGYEFGDMPSDYVRRDLRLLTMLWKARSPMGMTSLPAAALALEPARRLAWLMGRSEFDGLAPAALF